MSEQKEFNVNKLADKIYEILFNNFSEQKLAPPVGDLSAALGLVIGKIAYKAGAIDAAEMVINNNEDK